MPWQTLKIGGGGFTTGIDIASDGTKVCRIDVYGAYVCSNADPVWHQLVTASSIPAADRPPTATLTAGRGVFEIVIAPNNPARFYMMWNNRIYRSDNRGATWTRSATFPVITGNEPNTGAQRTFGRKMAVDPANADICYVGTRDNGLYATLDAGATWTSMTGAGVPVATGSTDVKSILIAFDATSTVSGGKTQVIYASSYGNGVYRSADGGTSWTLTASGPTAHSHMIVDQNGNLWLANYVQFLASQQNLWKFAGGIWTNFSGISQGTRCISIAVDRNNANNIYVGIDSGDLIRSTNGGSTWTGPSFNQSRIANDVPWLAWTQETYMSNGDMMFDYSGNLYFAEGIGVWKTASPLASGNIWTSQTAGIESLVGFGALSSPNYQYPFMFAADRPLWHSPGLDTYPSTHGAANTTSIMLSGKIDYASSAPGTVVGTSTWAGPRDQSAVTTDGAAWTIFATPPSFTSISANAATAIGGTVLSFAAVPSDVVIGMVVSDVTATAAIPSNTRVFSRTATTVTLDKPVASPGVSDGHLIRFTANISSGGLAVSTPTNFIFISSNNFWYPRVTQDGGVTWSNIDIAGLPKAMVGTLTSGSNSVVVSSSSDFVTGRGISGTGIPSGTTVSAKPDATHITLTQNASISGDTVLLPESGWGFSHFTPIHCVCADRVTVGKFYLYNYLNSRVYRSIDGGVTWAMTAASPDSGSGNLKIAAVPGRAGHVFFTGANAAFDNHPLRFSTNSGDSWTTVAGGLSFVHSFGFGAAAPSGTYPSIFVLATIGGVRGIYRTSNFDPTSNNPTWTHLGTYPNDSLDGMTGVEGDATILGNAYVSFAGSGWAYFSESNGGSGGGSASGDAAPIIPQSVLRRVSRLRKRRRSQ